jgi:hypothetical protein
VEPEVGDRQTPQQYAQESVSPNETVTAELVFDEKRDRYLLVHVGWQGARRIYG